MHVQNKRVKLAVRIAGYAPPPHLSVDLPLHIIVLKEYF